MGRSTSVVCALLLFVLTTTAVSAGHPSLKVGDTPPNDLGRDATGKRVHLEDYRGKLVIISFWASWCGPCRKEMPVLAAMQEQATQEKMVVFAVNWRESYEQFLAIKRVLKTTGLTLVSDQNGSLGKRYDVDAIPHMVIIGRDGRIAAVHVGYGEGAIPGLVDEINTLWNKASDSGELAEAAPVEQ